MAHINRKKIVIASVASAVLLLIFLGAVAVILLFNQRSAGSSDYPALKKEVESIQSAYKNLEAQGERYIGSVELARQGSVIEKSRLDAFQAARDELDDRLAVLNKHELSDSDIKTSIAEFTEKTSEAANEFMALSYAASTYTTCIVAPVGLPNSPEDFDKDKLALTNCRDTAKQLSTVDSESGKSYAKPILDNANNQLSYYDDLKRLGDFTSNENLEEYLDITDKITKDGSRSVAGTQPRQIIATQNDAVEAYNSSSSKLISALDSKMESRVRNE